MNFKPCPTLKKNYILKRNGVQKKNERKIKVQMIWYLYPTHVPISEKYLTWWSLTWWWDLTWWSQNDKFKSKQGREQTSSGGKTLLRLGDHPVIYKTGTDWNWDVMGKESDEYLVGRLEPRPLYAVLSPLTHANFYQRALENTSFCSCWGF